VERLGPRRKFTRWYRLCWQSDVDHGSAPDGDFRLYLRRRKDASCPQKKGAGGAFL